MKKKGLGLSRSNRFQVLVPPTTDPPVKGSYSVVLGDRPPTIHRKAVPGPADEPRIEIIVEPGSTFYALDAEIPVVTAALDRQFSSYGLVQSHSMHSPAAPTVIELILVGLSAGAGIVATKFLQEAGKSLWNVFKDLLKPSASLPASARVEPHFGQTEPTAGEAAPGDDIANLARKRGARDEIAGDRLVFIIPIGEVQYYGSFRLLDPVMQRLDFQDFVENGAQQLYAIAARETGRAGLDKKSSTFVWEDGHWVPGKRIERARWSARAG